MARFADEFEIYKSRWKWDDSEMNLKPSFFIAFLTFAVVGLIVTGWQTISERNKTIYQQRTEIKILYLENAKLVGRIESLEDFPNTVRYYKIATGTNGVPFGQNGIEISWENGKKLRDNLIWYSPASVAMTLESNLEGGPWHVYDCPYEKDCQLKEDERYAIIAPETFFTP